MGPGSDVFYVGVGSQGGSDLKRQSVHFLVGGILRLHCKQMCFEERHTILRPWRGGKPGDSEAPQAC